MASMLRHPFRNSQICVGMSASAGMSGRPLRNSQHNLGIPKGVGEFGIGFRRGAAWFPAFAGMTCGAGGQFEDGQGGPPVFS